MSSDAGDEVHPLACPTCARRYPLSERFCADCEMPLVYVGRAEEAPITATHERARKVKPQYAGGEPVKVAFARNLAEAQLIQGILLEEGIPSVERRSRGFDVPDFLAAGPRDILVPQAAFEVARELLADTGEHLLDEPPTGAQSDADRARRLLIGMAVAIAVAAALAWAVAQLAS